MLVALACVDKGEKAEGEGRGGQIENGAAGASIGGSSTSIGGSSTSIGGSSTSIGGSSTNSGGAHASSGGASAVIGGAGGQRLVDCDLRKVMCRAAQPSCAENQVPSVEGSCFGPCVPIESCACSASLDCPFSDRYTCWQRTHCGPYVR